MAKAAEDRDEENISKEVDLFGEFRFKVDAKGRVALPAKFRKVLSKDLVVSLELEHKCLYVFEQQGFNDWVTQLFDDKFGGYNASSRQHVMLRSKLKGNADGVEVDTAGRIVLNAKMREACGIDKDVVVLGNTGHFEIWDAKAYDETFEDVDLGIFYSD